MIPENPIDCHCHLDLLPDFPQAVEECERGGVYTLTMTTTPKAWPRNRELTARSRFVRAALGLHPQLISTHAPEIELWETYLPEARYIGEVGIDSGPRFFRSLELQKTIFERILRKCSQAGGKVLSVHSVRAGTLVLDG
jgi:TatD DNase family protein